MGPLHFSLFPLLHLHTLGLQHPHFQLALHIITQLGLPQNLPQPQDPLMRRPPQNLIHITPEHPLVDRPRLVGCFQGDVLAQNVQEEVLGDGWRAEGKVVQQVQRGC